MRASSQLFTYLKRREKFAAAPYRDSGGIWTIGYGHVILPHEKNTLKYLLEPAADALLHKDVAPIELYLDAINGNLPVSLSQIQFDGLVTLIFNIGLKRFERSTLLKLLRKGSMPAAAAQFDRWVYDQARGPDGIVRTVRIRGLINRRRMDRAIFEQGIYAD